MENPALGDLVYAVLEQHGAAVDAAVADILARARATLHPDQAQHLLGGVYIEKQAVRQPLQPGNWVTLGEVEGAAGVTFVDVNVATGAIRERCAWFRRGCPDRHLLPAQIGQAACRHVI